MAIWYRRIFCLLAAYAFQRILFFGFNYTALAEVHTLTLLLSVLDGIRFDLCVIATVNLPLMAMHGLRFSPVMNRSSKWIDNAVSTLFLLSNIPLIIFGIVDSRLFSFTGRRISPDMFAIGGDIKGQSLGILIQYWFITIPGLIAVVAFSVFTWQKNHSNSRLDLAWLKQRSLMILVTSLLGFLLIRGGWQTKPLAPAHAYSWQPSALANMVLNSGMTVLRTPPATAIHRYNDFDSMEKAQAQLSPSPKEMDHLPIAKNKNVVVLVVESLATEYVGFLNNGKGYTPFIDELSKNSVTFAHSFANGRRSIDAMPAIFAGIPAWREQPFVTSPYASNRIDALPRLLSGLGYQTMFFHGAANGSMHFDVFSKMAGFDQYIGRNEYPDPTDDDGQWGIFDEPFLQFAIEKFNGTPQPFFAGVFTLTSHNPFKIPEKFKGKFPKGTLPIHEAIGYADFALAEFFKTAANQPWYFNTIFVITGDHTSLSENPFYNNLPGRFRVPIIFFDPAGTLPTLRSPKIATHVDIKPTIMDLLGISSEHYGFFGGPLFDPAWSGRFIQQEYETWYYSSDPIQVVLKANNKVSFYQSEDVGWQTPIIGSPNPDAVSGLNTLKAARQYFSNGMLDNTWYTQ